MDEYRTAKDEIVRVGDHFRDTRKSNIRTLRVDRLEAEYAQTTAHCTVVRQEYNGEITTPNRPTSMNAERLASRSFTRAGMA